MATSTSSTSRTASLRASWRHLLASSGVTASAVKYLLAALAQADQTIPRRCQLALYTVGSVVGAVWCLAVLLKWRWYARNPHILTVLLLGLSALNSISFYWTPLRPASRNMFLQRMCAFAVLPTMAGRSVRESLPLLLWFFIPVHLVLDTLVQRRLCGGLHESQPPCSPPTLPYLVLGRILPTTSLLLVAVVAASIVAEDYTDDLAPGQQSESSQSAFYQNTNSRRPGLLHRYPALMKVKEQLRGVLFLSSLVNKCCWARDQAKALWIRTGKDDIAKFVLWPCCCLLMCRQILSISTGMCCSPLEALLALIVGVGLGHIEGKDMSGVLITQLTAITALAHDLVPSHIAQLLVEQTTESYQAQGSPRSNATSFCGSVHDLHASVGLGAQGMNSAAGLTPQRYNSGLSGLYRVSLPGSSVTCAAAEAGQGVRGSCGGDGQHAMWHEAHHSFRLFSESLDKSYVRSKTSPLWHLGSSCSADAATDTAASTAAQPRHVRFGRASSSVDNEPMLNHPFFASTGKGQDHNTDEEPAAELEEEEGLLMGSLWSAASIMASAAMSAAAAPPHRPMLAPDVGSNADAPAPSVNAGGSHLEPQQQVYRLSHSETGALPIDDTCTDPRCHSPRAGDAGDHGGDSSYRGDVGHGGSGGLRSTHSITHRESPPWLALARKPPLPRPDGMRRTFSGFASPRRTFSGVNSPVSCVSRGSCTPDPFPGPGIASEQACAQAGPVSNACGRLVMLARRAVQYNPLSCRSVTQAHIMHTKPTNAAPPQPSRSRSDLTCRAIMTPAAKDPQDCISPEASTPTLMQSNQRLVAFSHSAVTILFADIVGFTSLSKSLEPYQVFEFLNELYARYDAVVDSFRVYKVETIGDCYMCATGLIRDDPEHAAQMVRFAQEMQRQAAQVQMPDGSGPVRVRVGINSGPLLSGVIGRIRKRYCVIGSTVNLASRMESTGIPGRVHISSDTHALVQHLDEFTWECRGEVAVKGAGNMVTYLLED